MSVHKFGDLKDGDVVKVALDGLYKVSYDGEAWVRLESIDGHDDWSFDLTEGDGWEITKVAKEL